MNYTTMLSLSIGTFRAVLLWTGDTLMIESCPHNALSSVSNGMLSGSISMLRMAFRTANAPALEDTMFPSLHKGLRIPFK